MWMLRGLLHMGVLFCALATGCDVGDGRKTAGGRGADLGAGVDGGGGGMPGDGGATMSCPGDAADQTGCSCGPVGASRACWPAAADAKARGVGACKDGAQTCAGSGEFPGWSACTGAVTPVAEQCTNGIDDNCDGRIDCQDPTCATDPACNTGCTDGQTRPCYDGPAGTENVGTCKDGIQTCVGGKWPSTCAGEVLPAQENCSDARDHNCNHLPGCLDLFACVASPACQSTCKVDRTGCVCPVGAGDTATCPAGMVGLTVGATLTNPGTVECCPCTQADCSNAVCCAETVCAGSSQCSGYTCKTLPASCGGKVNFDCDDFPEDCDEPCCPCSNCP